MIAALILSALIGAQPVFHDVPAGFLLVVAASALPLGEGPAQPQPLYIAVLVVAADSSSARSRWAWRSIGRSRPSAGTCSGA